MATNTTTTPLSTVIGVFPDHEQADSAIDELRHTRFSYEHIRVIERGTGGFVDTLKGMFTGQASVASSAADNLTKMGMPDYEAQHYQRELDADHVLVLMNADDRPEEAFTIMRQNGAFDINSRLRVSPGNNSLTMAQTNDSRAARNADIASAAPHPDGVRATDDPNSSNTASTSPYPDPPDTAPASPYPDGGRATYDPNTSNDAPSSDPDQPVDRDAREAPHNA